MNGLAPAPLYRLVYASLVTPETAADLEARMRDILVVSHRLNRRDGVTGLLISEGEWFVQALEGDEAAVEACFGRIELDLRHDWVRVRSRGPAAERLFERWSMCGVTLSALDDALLAQPDIGMNPFDAPPEAVLQMLFSLSQRRSAQLNAIHAELASRTG